MHFVGCMTLKLDQNLMLLMIVTGSHPGVVFSEAFHCEKFWKIRDILWFQDQAAGISKQVDINKALDDLSSYAQRNLYDIEKDTTQLFTWVSTLPDYSKFKSTGGIRIWDSKIVTLFGNSI